MQRVIPPENFPSTTIKNKKKIALFVNSLLLLRLCMGFRTNMETVVWAVLLSLRQRLVFLWAKKSSLWERRWGNTYPRDTTVLCLSRYEQSVHYITVQYRSVSPSVQVLIFMKIVKHWLYFFLLLCILVKSRPYIQLPSLASDRLWLSWETQTEARRLRRKSEEFPQRTEFHE